MKRYVTTDTLTSEIVHESNHHPLLQPLRAHRTPRTGLYIKRRPLTRFQRDVASVAVLMLMAVAMSCWLYAFH